MNTWAVKHNSIFGKLFYSPGLATCFGLCIKMPSSTGIETQKKTNTYVQQTTNFKWQVIMQGFFHVLAVTLLKFIRGLEL